MAAISVFVSPKALSRPNSRARVPKKPTQKKPQRNPNLKLHPPKPKSSHKLVSIGVEATTYTRLPPRDEDFLSVSSLDPLFQEIKLSESPLPQLDSKADPHFKKIGEGFDVLEEEDEKSAYDVEFGEGKFEVYDGELDSDEEDGEYYYEGEGEEEGEDEEYDDGSAEVMGFDEGAEEYGDQFKGEEFEEKEDKEKGVPAVMRCFDVTKIYVKAGNGGNGVVAFRREKFVPLGGPSGGDGGKGGNVYVEVDPSMNSLLPFRKGIHFRAGRGRHGQGSNQHGANGEDVVVKVPPGTVVREAGSDGFEGMVLFELLHPGQRALLLPGGRGGRGNASFKSGGNRVPRIAENGEEGPEMWLELELKLVADVGIIGAPNAGKSTLLSVISLARPKIANYPFTTLLPNLGVVAFDYDSTMVVADLPGLLEGAHRGFGLGHEFLRHTERCSVLVYVVDGSSPQPVYEFEAVRLELELFNPHLAEKPYLVAYNKMDLPDASDKWSDFKEKLQSKGIEPFCMSAMTKEGTYEVSCAAYELVKKSREEIVRDNEGLVDPVNLNYVAEMIRQRRRASINEFEIAHESGSDMWLVSGSGLERFIQMTNWRYVDSEVRFQHVLEASGVNKSLISQGVKEGDTVIVGGMEWVWHDAPVKGGPSSMRRRSAQSAKWTEWK